MRRLALAFGLAMFTVPLAACGDDDDDGGTIDANTTRDAPVTTPDGGTTRDAATADGGARDGGAMDGGARDGGT